MTKSTPTRKEWLIVIGLSCVIIASTFIPMIVGRYKTAPDRIMTEVGSSSQSDTYTYLAWIEQARQGHILFKQLYSSELQTPALFHPLFLILGIVGRLTHFSNITIYQIARAGVGFVFLVVSYYFISCFFQDRRVRILSFIILATSSGVGFVFGSLSTDMWMTESISYLGIYQTLLNTFSLALILGIFASYIKYMESRRLPLFLLCIALLNILTVSHTYDWLIAVTVLGVYSTYLSWRDKKLDTIIFYLRLLLFSFPAIFIVTYALNKNSILGIWANYQSNVPAPQVQYYLSGYGFLGILAVLGMMLIFVERKKKYYFLVSWVITALLLIYSPFLVRFQRKFGEGLHIPLSLLATVGLVEWVDWLRTKDGILKNSITAFIIFFLSLTNVYIIYIDSKPLIPNSYPYSISVEDFQSVEWLKSNAHPSQIILSGYHLGNLVPGITGNTVYLGHYDQTVDFKYKYQLVPLLMAARPNHSDPLKKFVQDEHISYIVVDEEARSWGVTNYNDRSYLESVYKNSDVEIYKVK